MRRKGRGNEEEGGGAMRRKGRGNGEEGEGQ